MLVQHALSFCGSLDKAYGNGADCGINAYTGQYVPTSFAGGQGVAYGNGAEPEYRHTQDNMYPTVSVEARVKTETVKIAEHMHTQDRFSCDGEYRHN